ncbi:sugar phosphate isomerase/epimerase family protein [Alkalibacter saccharofermentans]|uniref:Sugar phosphate isomerase/epimerase n=1 Tax=Alkalibacter saccharofermentans DSM 14828 TaxID=1120975 RepID=A0A1M4U4T0_9FIRM|nr:sugar phosphate isomerase/epimerase [Alkalibacter saccharofermentans]SHE51663.1 Sugar phosphate isomerase/epimerase [Alkalibacter saccharofermentans DSM 14828]
MHIGCHAVLFKDRIKTDTEGLIKDLKSTGFEGSEIGSRFFGTEDKAGLIKILDKFKYQMSAMHVVGELNDFCDAEKTRILRNRIMTVAEFVKDMPNKNIMFSGIDQEGIRDFKSMALSIDSIAKECADIGVALNYHNHNWEFEKDRRIFNALADHAPNLKLGFDLGWVYKTGNDPIELVKEYRDRINYVHLRDLNDEKEFVEIGEGIMDFKTLIPLLKEVLDEDGWAVVEYEDGEEDIERYKRAYVYISKLF